jgi:hypothetical protein
VRLAPLGGKQGFGRISYPYPKHAETWEPTVRAMTASALRNHIYNMNEQRHAIERTEPRHYMAVAYFERHLTALATLLVEKGLTTREELEALAGGSFQLSGPVGPGRQPAELRSFEIGETVRVKKEYVPGHVRMPAFTSAARPVSWLGLRHLIRFRTPRDTACRRRWSQPTMFVFAPAISGQSHVMTP